MRDITAFFHHKHPGGVVHHCGGAHVKKFPELNYTIVPDRRGMHRIDVDKAIGHDEQRKPVWVRFRKKHPEGGYLLESGVIMNKTASSGVNALVKEAAGMRVIEDQSETTETRDGLRYVTHDTGNRRRYLGNGAETRDLSPIDVNDVVERKRVPGSDAAQDRLNSAMDRSNAARIQKVAAGLVPKVPGVRVPGMGHLKNALKPVAGPVNKAIAIAGNRIRPRI